MNDEKRTFKLELMINKLTNVIGFDDQQLIRYQNLIPLIDYFFKETEMDEDVLAEYSMEDFEWFYDLICYWPTWEMECEREDLNHDGVQRIEIIDFIQAVSNLPQAKKKVAFI